MGCDIESNRRRRLWEKDVAATALEPAGLGFANRGHPSIDYWLEFDEEQLDPQWQWVNSGFVLTNRTPDGLQQGQWWWSDLPSLLLITFSTVGRVTTQFRPDGTPFSVAGTLLLSSPLPGLPPGILTGVAATFIIAPQVTDFFQFETFSDASSPLGLPVNLIGPAIVTPLSRCHDCVT